MYGQQPPYGVQNNKRPRMDDRPQYGQPQMAGGAPGYGSYASNQMPAPGYGQPPAYGAPYGGGAGPTPDLAGYERIYSCVKLRGLPFSVVEDEIRGFLVRERMDGFGIWSAVYMCSARPVCRTQYARLAGGLGGHQATR